MVFDHLFISFLPYFCILSLATVSIILSERVGIVNLGVNGMIVVGATAYMVFAHAFSNNGTQVLNGWIQIPLFILSGLFGLIYSLLHGLVCIKLKANQIISGIALNTLAPAITVTILFIFGTANKLPYTVEELAVGNAANYEWTNLISLKVFVSIAIVAFFAVVLAFTKWGLRLKSIGENPQAADVAGINVNRMKWIVTMISGFIAGIAGAIYISSLSSGNQFNGSVEGLGFLAIAIMIVGRWKIVSSTIAVIVFSILFSIGLEFRYIFPNEKESLTSIIKMIPYLIALLILMIFSKPVFQWLAQKFHKKEKISKVFINLSQEASGPKATGEPYDKSKR